MAEPTTDPTSPTAHRGGESVRLRSLVPTVYLPSLLFAAGQGAVVPVVALTAREMGASVAVASVAVAVRGIGTMLFNIPAGMLVARWGERVAMLVGTAMLVASLLGCILAPSPLAFCAAMFLMGCGWSVWLLARLTYISDVVPLRQRGRALAGLGGVQRIGGFLGPFLGAGAIALADTDGAYYVHLVLAVIGCAVLCTVPLHGGSAPLRGGHVARPLGVLREHRPTFATVGVVAIAISVLRAARQVLLPLFAENAGLGAREVSIVFGLSAALDMTLFLPAGKISDTVGRKAVAVPALVLMALGTAALPLTHSFAAITAAGLVIGLGNGLSSGLVMTLGADFTPAVGRAEFLGMWRLVSDVGTAGGPLLVSAVEAVVSLSAGAWAIGGLGIAGVGFLTTFRDPVRRRAGSGKA